MDITKVVAENVKRIRKNKFGTVREACEHSQRMAASKRPSIRKGITVPRWYRLENGKHPRMVAPVIGDIAKVLGVTVGDLLTQKNERGATRARAKKKNGRVNQSRRTRS